MRKKLVILLAACMLFLMPSAAFARDVAVSTSAEFVDALINQQDGDVITLAAGTYDVGKGVDQALSAGGQKGWYLPVVANDVVIKGAGIGKTAVTSSDVSANGVWSSQDFFAVFGDRASISDMTIIPKIETNKAIEVMGKDVKLENLSIEANPLAQQPEYNDPSNPSMWFGTGSEVFSGSIYFNPSGSPDDVAKAAKNVGDATIKNVTLQAHISTGGRSGVLEGAINLDGVTIDYTNMPYDAWDLRESGWGAISNNDHFAVVNDGLTVLVDNEDINYTRDILSLVPTDTVVEFAPGAYDLGTGEITRPIVLKGTGSDPAATTFETSGVTFSGEGALEAEGSVIVVHVEGLSLSPDSPVITVGSTLAAEPVFTPAEATERGLTWASSDPTIAAVDAKGVISALASGVATITATSTDNAAVSAEMRVMVVKPQATSVKLNRTSAKLATGKSLTLKATVSPSNVDTAKVTWRSSNPKVATVSSKGVVKALKPGSATITATSVSNPEKKASAKITVQRPVKKITVRKTKFWLRRGTTWDLRLGVSPKSATVKKFIIKSSSKFVKMGQNGIIKVSMKARHLSKVILTIKSSDGFGAVKKVFITITKYRP